MKKVIIMWIIIIFLTASFTGCAISNEPSEDISGLLNYSSFLELLTEHDFQYTEGGTDPVNQSFLSVARSYIFVENEIISIYEYKSNEVMERDSTHINENGLSISYPGKGIEISWVSYPTSSRRI